MDLQADMDMDAMFMEHDNSGENDWSMDRVPFVKEYQRAVKEYGMGTTFMEEFNHDQYAGECVETSTICLGQETNGSLLLFSSVLISAWHPSICYCHLTW